MYDSKTLLQYCKPKTSLEKLVLRIAFLTLSNNISYLQYRNMATKRYSTTHASLQNNLHNFNIFFFAAYAKSYTFHGGTRAVSVYHTSVDHYCVPSIYHTWSSAAYCYPRMQTEWDSTSRSVWKVNRKCRNIRKYSHPKLVVVYKPLKQ